MRSMIVVIALALSALAVTPRDSDADVMWVDLTSGNAALSGFSSPYARVGVERLSDTTAQIYLETYGSYKAGDGSTLGLNVNGTGLTAGPISYTGSDNPANFTVSTGGSYQVDGWGLFNFVIDTADGASQAVQTMTFLLTASSAIWSTNASVLTLNAQGALAVSHIFTGVNGITGFAAGTGVVTPPDILPVPEPTSLLLLGGGLMVVAVTFRRRAGRSRRQPKSA